MAKSDSGLLMLVGLGVGALLVYKYAQANCPGQSGGFCGLWNGIFGPGANAAPAGAPQPGAPPPAAPGAAAIVVTPVVPFTPSPRVLVTSVNGAPAGTDAQHTSSPAVATVSTTGGHR